MKNLKIEETSKTLVDLVEDKLLEYFKEYNILPGDSIPTEMELSKALGVGRSVLREALSRFRMLGLITSRTRRGMFFSEPDLLGGLNKVIMPAILSKAKINEIMGLRIALEIGNSYFIVKNVTDSDIEELEEIINQGDVTTINKFGVDLEYAFHSKLHKIAGNDIIFRYQKVFYKVFEYVYENLQDYVEEYNLKKSKLNELITHKDLVQKLKERDYEGFQSYMKKHLELYIDYIQD